MSNQRVGLGDRLPMCSSVFKTQTLSILQSTTVGYPFVVQLDARLTRLPRLTG
jgi:hypothetical protein